MNAPTPFYISREDLLVMAEVRRSQQERGTHATDSRLADRLDGHLGYRRRSRRDIAVWTSDPIDWTTGREKDVHVIYASR